MPLLDPSTQATTLSTDLPNKPIVLHLGDKIEYDLEYYKRLNAQFDIRNPPLSDLQRPAFLQHLRNKTWGNFQAIMRPFWNTGGEMGRWDRELIDLLPEGLKVYSSAGAGYDWVDVDVLAERGMFGFSSDLRPGPLPRNILQEREVLKRRSPARHQTNISSILLLETKSAALPLYIPPP